MRSLTAVRCVGWVARTHTHFQRLINFLQVEWNTKKNSCECDRRERKKHFCVWIIKRWTKGKKQRKYYFVVVKWGKYIGWLTTISHGLSRDKTTRVTLCIRYGDVWSYPTNSPMQSTASTVAKWLRLSIVINYATRIISRHNDGAWRLEKTIARETSPATVAIGRHAIID